MATYQLYVVNTLDQAHHLQSEEPIEFYQDDDQCADCDVVVGIALNKFFPCVVCVNEDDDDYWIVCQDCASSVITPGQ
jgi:hypothetical protein